MIYKNIKIKTSSGLKQGLSILPDNIFLPLKEKSINKIILKAGTRQVQTVIRGDSNISDTILISPELADLLCLPADLASDLVLNVKVDLDTRSIQMGPFIGIYGFKRLNSVKRIFSEQTSYFRKLCQTAYRYNAIAYIVAPEDLNFNDNYTYGHILQKTAEGFKWEEKPLPLPDVFYDRGLFPKGPNKRKSMLTRRYLRQTWGEKFFNPKFFNKWRTHKWLSEHPMLVQYLPDTEKLNTLEFPEHFFKKYQSFYLKPAGGSSGRRILRVQQVSANFVCDFVKNNKYHRWVYQSGEELWQDILNKGMINITFIIQADLNLALYNSRPFDMRIIMQKGLEGEWSLTGMAARVAGYQSVTTNLHAGGKAQQADAILIDIFGNTKGTAIINEIEKVCHLACTEVEEIANLKFGEIAIDIGVSTSGKLWIIELNAVPGRTVFRKIKDYETARKAVSKPIEYSLYLAGFNISEKSNMGADLI